MCIRDSLSQDRADPLGPSPNLLPIHYHLTELETFRNETLAQAKKSGSSWGDGGPASSSTGSGSRSNALAPSSPDPDAPAAQQLAHLAGTRETLERYFERLGETIEAFEAHYFRLARELVVLARRGHASVAVRLCKVAEVEGARDQRAIAIRMVKKAGNVDVAARFRSLQADARTLKHYRARVLDAVRDGCRTDVEKSFRRAGEDGVRWIDELDWVFDDIVTVRELLVDKFPDDWKVRLLPSSSFFCVALATDPRRVLPRSRRLSRSSAPNLLVTSPFTRPASVTDTTSGPSLAASRGTTRRCTTSWRRWSSPSPTRRRSSACRSSRKSTSRR